MQILNIMQGTHIGGTEKSSLTLMKEMQKRGIQFSVMSLTEMGKLKTHLDDSSIPYVGFDYKGFGGWKSFFSYRNYIKSIEADAIMMTGHNLVGMLAIGSKCRGNRSLFIHFHHEGVKKNWEWKLIYFIANLRFDRIYFASNFILKEAIKIFPRIKEKSIYLPNPLPSKKLISNNERKVARDAFGIIENEIVIGNAGWLIPRKRFDVFLHVCAQIKEKHKKIKILIAGDGEEKNNLLRLSKELGIHEDIIWLGWIDNLDPFYNSIDFMIFNSDWDSVGLSPLEAIQRGIKTYASVLNGGLKEILHKDFSVFIEDNHDIEALSRKIVYAINNSDSINELTEKCRVYINNLSDPKLISVQIINDYNTKV